MEKFGDQNYLKYDKPMKIGSSALVGDSYLYMALDNSYYMCISSPSNLVAAQEFADNYNAIRNSPLIKALT